MSSSKRTTLGDGHERPQDSPDFTSSIMQRLGYAPVTPEIVRKTMIRKWVGRIAFLSLVLAAIIVGTNLQSRSPNARLPHGPTIPSAFKHDLTYHGATIDRAIHSIKNLSPRLNIVPAMDMPKSVPIEVQPVPVEVGFIIHKHFGWA